jgi:hypothetical protein
MTRESVQSFVEAGSWVPFFFKKGTTMSSAIKIELLAVVFILAKQLGVILLANKNYPIRARETALPKSEPEGRTI